MAAYRELYAFCQELTPPLRRNVIREKILALTGVRVKTVVSGLNTDLVYGFCVHANNKEHPFVKRAGCSVIVVARDLDENWRRFVIMKELMHQFDTALEQTNTGPDLENVLLHFFTPEGEMSPQMRSEIRCFWMALACYCPEDQRAQLQHKRDSGSLQDAEIAVALRLPEKYIPNLFHERYKEIVGKLID